MVACPAQIVPHKLAAVPEVPHPLADAPLWIVAPTHWRETCFSLPATRALAELRRVHVLCPIEQKGLWQAAGIAEVQTFEASTKPRALAKELADISQCLLWENGVGAHAMVHARVPTRLGLPSTGLEKHLTKAIGITQRPGPPTHQVRRFLDTVAQLGASPFEPRHFNDLPSPVPRAPGTLLLSPDSDFGTHYSWPAERWIALLEGIPLAPERVRIQASGPIAQALANASGIPLIESLDPLQLAAFERGIFADSSVAHLAAAFGVTCAVLFGPGDPERTRPLGKQHLSIRQKAECSPCLMDKCPLDLRCQLELQVDHVRDALGSFMDA